MESTQTQDGLYPTIDSFISAFNSSFRSDAMDSARRGAYRDFFQERYEQHLKQPSPYLRDRAWPVALDEARLLSYILGDTVMYDLLERRRYIKNPSDLVSLTAREIIRCQGVDFQRYALFHRLHWRQTNTPTYRDRPIRSYTDILYEIYAHPILTAHFGKVLDIEADFAVGKCIRPRRPTPRKRI